MAINTFRIVMMFFVLNLLMGMAMGDEGLYRQLGNLDTDRELHGYEDQKLIEMSDSSTWYDTQKKDSYETESTAGDGVQWGANWLDIIWNAVNPLSINPSDFDNRLEKIGAYAIMLFRSLMSLIAGLMIYMLIKNRMTN